MGVGGKLTALPGLKIQNIRSAGRALFREQRLRLPDGLGGKAERRVPLLAPGDGLEDHVGGRAVPDGLDLGGYVAENADLRRDLPLVFDLVKPAEDLGKAVDSVVHRV